MALATCSTLATDPANGLVGDAAIKSASSAIVPASGANKAYCSVKLLYGTNPNQNINIVLALPLNAVDGGSGGLTGAWNGRTQGLGGGGCAGISSVNPAMLAAITEEPSPGALVHRDAGGKRRHKSVCKPARRSLRGDDIREDADGPEGRPVLFQPVVRPVAAGRAAQGDAAPDQRRGADGIRQADVEPHRQAMTPHLDGRVDSKMPRP
jgi:hypothetical protein